MDCRKDEKMANVQNILTVKGQAVWTVPADAQVREALQVMVEKNIGAVLVVADGQINGIFSERDYARHVSQQDDLLLDQPVSGLMTRSVYYVHPQQTVEDCMAIMTSRHIRHLPVLDQDNALAGLVSIGDVINNILQDREHTIKDLKTYILGQDVSS
jgi:CBS domain-containing protein